MEGYIQKYVPKEEKYDELVNLFTYHPVTGDQAERYEFLRSSARDLAKAILSLTPASREQSLAFTSLQQAIMWANAAIAINETQENK